MNPEEDRLLARVRCRHGYWFLIYDKCPVEEQPEKELLPKLTRKERRQLKRGKL